MSINTTGGRAGRFLRSGRKFAAAMVGVAGLAFASLAPTAAYAYLDGPTQTGGTIELDGTPNQVINIWCTSTEPCGQSQGTVVGDQTIFAASPNPTQPSTGTGVFQPFLRTQRGTGQCGTVDGTGNNSCITFSTPDNKVVYSESGYNTDNPQNGINFNTKNGKWTHEVQMSDIAIINGYIVLSLDANQLGQAQTDLNKIVLNQMEIFIGPGLADPETCGGYTGSQFDLNANNQKNDKLCGQKPNWSLDSQTNGNVDVVLQASICDTNGQCGSGKGDLDVFIPVSAISGFGTFNPTDNFVLYTEFLYANDGFEEWRFAAGASCCSFPVPEPGTLGLFGFGLAGLGLMRRRKKELTLARA